MSPQPLRHHYRAHSKNRLSQGDIAYAAFHQLRTRPNSQPKGPGPEEHTDEGTPFLGPYVDYPIETARPGSAKPLQLTLRLWQGFVMVVSQGCEIDYASDNDSRLLVAPIVSEDQWPQGPWGAIRSRSLPGFTYIPPVEPAEVPDANLPEHWPGGAVCHASTTCVSRDLIKRPRILALQPAAILELQRDIVLFCSVRGWADHAAAVNLVGKTIVDVQETAEMVPGPARLSKLFLREGDDGDEATVVVGVRPKGK